jgi:hypothetical protein
LCRCMVIIRLLIRNLRPISQTVALIAVIVVCMGIFDFFSHPIPGAKIFPLFVGSTEKPIERHAPDGSVFTVDPGPATFALDLGPEDTASQQVFPDYASALRYAHEHGLPTIPSVSLVLAACRATDDRLQIAVETDLDRAADDGRVVLLRRWLDVLVQRRAAAAGTKKDAYDGAVRYLASAIEAGGDGAYPSTDLRSRVTASVSQRDSDPPLGPWASSPDLSAAWHRDRYLAQALTVTDDASAATAAVLARCLVDDPMLSAGWARQAAVARAFLGPMARTTFESVAADLAGIPTDELAGPASCTRVRKLVAAAQDASVAPGAVASTSSPEEAILSPLGMSAWNDPVGSLIAALRAGTLNLTPAIDAGFYRHRWFALESLAAPDVAPEHRKLQLSAAYAERWQRAFAAGFTEGRSSLVKRLPVITLGLGPLPPPTRVPVSPEFSAEPAPVLYLRLSRAYRALSADLTSALGPERWRSLRDEHGEGIAAAMDRRAQVLFGIACLVYHEIGFPIPLAEDESAIDRESSQAAATSWCAGAIQDPDLSADARVLVTLATDGRGRHRCPAIAGVHLEPVEYRWVDKPFINGDIAPVWTPTRLWLASPCPVMVTFDRIPSLKEFRARCDGLHSMAQIAAAFSDSPPRSQLPVRRQWPWVLGAMLCCSAGILAVRWWMRQRWGRKLIAAVLTCSLLLTLSSWAAAAPPYWLIYLVATRFITMHENLALAFQWRMHEWSGEYSTRLFFDLFTDPDPQLRYLACWLQLKVNPDRTDDIQRSLLRSAIDDNTDEVARYSWAMLCANAEETVSLLQNIDVSRSTEEHFYRLNILSKYRRTDPQVISYALQLADAPPSERRSNSIRCLALWKRPAEIIADRLRIATADPDYRIRKIAVSWLGENGNLTDIPTISGMWQDNERSVRLAAFNAMGKQIQRRHDKQTNKDSPLQWADPSIQIELTRYASNDKTTCDELLVIGRWLADPAALRACCLRALPMAKQLPPFTGSYLPGSSKETALSTLVVRWFLADRYARLTIEDGVEQDGNLVQAPWLLTRLAESMEAQHSPGDILDILRQGLARPDREQTVLWFVERLGPQAASLANDVATLYEHGPIRETRIGCLDALAAMGDPVARRALPYLDVIAKDPDDGWWAIRMRDKIVHDEKP